MICLFTSTVAGSAVAAASPLGASEGMRLQNNLDLVYKGRPVPPHAWDGVDGRAAACIVLGRVVAHMRDTGRAAADKNLTFLSWAHELVRFDDARAELPFVDALMRKRLIALLDRYHQTPRFSDALVTLMDATRAWTPRHLPFLAERAGRGSFEERAWFVERARLTGPWAEDDVRRLLRFLRSTSILKRTPEQWGLIGLTGQATSRELIRILQLAATAFASGDPDSRVLDEDHPIRMTIEDLVERFDEGDAQASTVVEAATTLSEDEGDRVTPLAARRLFYEAIHDDEVEVAETPAAPPSTDAAEKPRPAKRVRFRSRFKHEGNVYYPDFPCAGNLTR